MLALAALTAVGTSPAAATSARARTGAPAVECHDSTDAARRLDFPNGAFGYYALPAGRPAGLVVFAHGHSNSAYKWRRNLTDTARSLGVIAVAMDYRGQTFPHGEAGDSFGWRVREGAEDSIAAAKLFQRTCLRSHGRAAPDARPIVIYGPSMGGNTSGLAVAARPKRSDGRPLFDYWFDIEGVTNAVETYLEARAVAGPPLSNTTGQTAVREFYEENGDKAIEDDPRAYADLAVINHADEIGAAGLKGVVMVHGADDGTVPSNQTDEMFARLVQERVPTDLFIVGRHGQGAPAGNTLEDTFTLTSRIPGYTPPLSGHGDENDPTQPVVGVGFDRLAKLFGARRAPRCFHAWAYDDGAYVTDPEQLTLPDC